MTSPSGVKRNTVGTDVASGLEAPTNVSSTGNPKTVTLSRRVFGSIVVAAQLVGALRLGQYASEHYRNGNTPMTAAWIFGALVANTVLLKTLDALGLRNE